MLLEYAPSHLETGHSPLENACELLPQKRGHAIGHLTDHDDPPELRRGGPIGRLA